jgi:prolyl oligopeptidase
MTYPNARRMDLVETLHGHAVPDPYRWLEDPKSDETRAWIEAQNELTFAHLAKLPRREAIERRLTELWDYERYGVPSREGGRYFFFKNDGLQNQPVLWVAPSLGAEARVLLDPNTLSPDGTVALAGMEVSRDGKRLAYGLSKSGSDWTDWRVRDVETGVDLADDIRWVRFSGASWTPDGSGFFYSRYDEPPAGEEYTAAAYFQKLCFHRIGTPQSEDVLVYERPDQKEWGFGGGVTWDGRYLIIGVWHGTDPKSRLFYREAVGGKIVELLREADAAYRFIGNDGPVFYLWTDLDAPRGRLIAIDTREPARDRWRTLIHQSEDTLEGVSLVGDRFVASYLRDAHARVLVFSKTGKLEREVALPGLGTASGFGGDPDSPETFFSYTSYTTPACVYRLDVSTGETQLWRAPRVKFEPDLYESRQVFVTSKDGTRVPLFLTHKKGLVLDGENPTYLYGYGGFNISITPAFDVGRLVWMELGGVLAVANLRGGGEYGEEWHQAGCGKQKQNVFDDFTACASWLVDHKVSRPAKIGIGGASNGGLLIGACMAQRPELFACALPDVGVMDMLRFHKFTIGWAWVSDYGSPDDPAAFETLLAYSPYHNLKPGTRYPATFITTADTDDRVVAAHSFKFAAALQHAQAPDGPPVFIRVETKAGHGAGKPTSKQIQVLADRWAFLLGVTDGG